TPAVWFAVRVGAGAEAGRVEAGPGSSRRADARVSVEPRGGFDRPPMEPTPASQALYARAQAAAAALGFELGAARVGGASDGNLTAAAGVPTLDGLGPPGSGAHARGEPILLSRRPRRGGAPPPAAAARS